MLVDHVGLAFFPEADWLRAVGRLAMPLFCYLLAAGFARTGSPDRYAMRLLGWAVLSQPVFWWFDPGPLGWWSLNVLFTLLLGLGWLAWRQQDAFSAWAVLGGLAAASLWAGQDILTPFSYGTYGLLMVALCDLFLVRAKAPSTALASAALLATSLAWWLWAGMPLLQAGAAAGPLAAGAVLRQGRPLRLRGRWFYAFYPAHLLLLGILTRLMGLPLP